MTQIGYNVEIDKEKLAEAISLFEFVGGNSDRALQVAINRTGKKVKTLSSRTVREQINLKKSYVDGRLTFFGASRKQLTGKISSESRGILLSRFSTDTAVKNNGEKTSLLQAPKAPPRGIRVKVKPSGGTKALSKDFFYMKLKNSGAIGIARRLPKGQTGPRGGKYDVLYGPSVSQAFNSVRDQVLPEAGRIYESELLDAMRFLLAKQYPKD